MDDVEKLIQYYRGHPLALKIAATSILDLFNGNISDFLENTTVSNGDRNLLNHQFERLSPLKAEVMYWTYINREPLQVSDLQNDLDGEFLANARDQTVRIWKYLQLQAS